MRIMQEDLRIIDGRVCRLKSYLFTCAIEVGVTAMGHQRRYCYEKVEHAKEAFAVWDGQEHPPGPWIKCKSATQEILNPVWSAA